jgi:hypothetical protein
MKKKKEELGRISSGQNESAGKRKSAKTKKEISI